MKLAVVLLVLLPLAFSAPQERGLLDLFGGLNLDVLKNTVQDLVDVVGTDATEQICEGKCHTLILGDETALLHTLCTPICRSLQALAHTFNLRPQTAQQQGA